MAEKLSTINKVKFPDGRTRLPQSDYKDAAKVIRAKYPGENWVPLVKATLGTPYWDKKGNAVKKASSGEEYYLKSAGKNSIATPTLAAEKANRAKQKATRDAKQSFTDPTIEAWAEELEKTGKMPKGKSLKDFLKKEKALDTRQKNLVKEANKKAGFNRFEDGHAGSLGNEQKVNTPLRLKGTYGSHSGSARAVEPRGQNNQKQHRGDVGWKNLDEAGIATDRLKRFSQYLTGSRGTLAKPTKGDVLKVMQGQDPNKVISQRDQANQYFKQLGGHRPLQTSVDTDKAMKLSDTMKLGKDSVHQSPFGMPIYKP
tara:strand:- start:234 stop:1172 length:939 start_codon:yes stop_codon:yes gene_type:complete